MPHLRGVAGSPGGPVIEFFAGVSKPHADVLRSKGTLIPSVVMLRGLIDTGATCTCIDPESLASLGLTATGSAHIQTPSTEGTPHVCNQYDVSLVFPLHTLTFTIPAIPIVESRLQPQGIDALIGRDVLSRGVLIYDGVSGMFSLGF